MPLEIDTREINKFLRDLKASGLTSDVEMRAQFAVTLKEAGELVAAAARRNASFSTRIPRTIKTRRRGGAVQVVAGGSKAPGAMPIDHRGVPGIFRHPVFGRWISGSPGDQKAHPFMEPALIEAGPAAEAAIEAELDRTIHKVYPRG